MSIVRVKSFLISGVNCNGSSAIRTKKTEGQRVVKRNLTCLRRWRSCFPTVRIPASTRQVVAASLCRGAQPHWRPARRHSAVATACHKDNSRRAVSRGGCFLELYPGGADFSTALPPQFYRFSTTRGAGLTISSSALTFWIWAACSLSWAVRVPICFCCSWTTTCNFSTLSLSMA